MSDEPKVRRSIAPTKEEVTFLTKVVGERQRQERSLGYSDEHDDAHTYTDFLSFIRRQLYSIQYLPGTSVQLDDALSIPENLEMYERRLVKVAALAMAAANSARRKAGK